MLFSFDEWSGSTSDINGLAFIGDDYRFILSNKWVAGKYHRYSPDEYDIPDLLRFPLYPTQAEALLDFNGEANTANLFSVFSPSLTREETIFEQVIVYRFPNGQQAYIPSCGELSVIFNYIDMVQRFSRLFNEDSDLFGGTLTQYDWCSSSLGLVSSDPIEVDFWGARLEVEWDPYEPSNNSITSIFWFMDWVYTNGNTYQSFLLGSLEF